MCGLCGAFSLTEKPISLEHVRAMTDAIAHRGPDDSGYHVHGPIGLGHRRLSIIDLSERGHQPMWSSDGSMCVVFNGEIYNYEDIARDLIAAGVRFDSHCDTEVVVNAVRHWGAAEAVRRFIGMFAFAVWDVRNGELTLVRDRVGVKPLFFSVANGLVLFGSEVRAILAHPEFEKRLDRRGLGQFFVTGFTLGETTAFESIKRVLPGHIVSIRRDGTITQSEYWNLSNYTERRANVSIEDAAEELEALLESAVAYRLVADVPVANFLSGGIDSSLVASILKKNLGQDVLNITVGFREGAFDESTKASAVAKQLGLNHVVRYVTSDDVTAGLTLFPEIFDEPFGDTSGIPTYFLSKFAREHVKVSLSADGGDEQFCGYDSYARYNTLWNRLEGIPSGLRSTVSELARRLPWRGVAGLMAARAAGSLRPQSVARMEKAVRLFGVGTRNDLVRSMSEKAWTWNDAATMMGTGSRPLYDRTVLSDPELAATSGELTDTMMRADYRTFLRDNILTKVDRASMHVSLEARDPMLDHRLAEFAFQLPLDLICGDGEDKRLLKVLLRRSVSNDIVNSPKRGFSIPLYAWMRGVWQPVVREFLSTEAVTRIGILDPNVVRSEVDRFYNRPGGSAERIWMLLNFQMWADRWL